MLWERVTLLLPQGHGLASLVSGYQADTAGAGHAGRAGSLRGLCESQEGR
jgi:hypothetical protein